jgi:hypothetical protein
MSMASSKVLARSKALVKLLEVFRSPPIATIQNGLLPHGFSNIPYLLFCAVVPPAIHKGYTQVSNSLLGSVSTQDQIVDRLKVEVNDDLVFRREDRFGSGSSFRVPIGRVSR